MEIPEELQKYPNMLSVFEKEGTLENFVQLYSAQTDGKRKEWLSLLQKREESSSKRGGTVEEQAQEWIEFRHLLDGGQG